VAAFGTLIVVGTPIGNLEDLSERARRVLRDLATVAAEDTRRTGRLLERVGGSARLVSFFEGNERERLPGILGLLRGGQDVGLVTDAGMPTISDPGFRLVAACVDAGIPVEVVPGPSAAIAALAVSGLPTDRFVFEGFLPRTGGARRDRLAALASEPRTAVLFESSRRVSRTIADLLDACGDRRVAICRELTKLHEEVRRGTVAELVVRYGAAPKGEVTLVLAPGAVGGGRAGPADDALRELAEALGSRRAASLAARLTGLPRNRLYAAITRARR
jgi:16S rRNA (cytidine1402-2'-O)-methyltransferase